MKFHVKVMTGLLVFALIFCVALPMIVSKAADGGSLDPGGNSGTDKGSWEEFGKEQELPADKEIPALKVYTKSAIEKDYRIFDEKTGSFTYHAPVLEGYLFAGWYKAGDYKNKGNALREGEKLTQDAYYALFVPEKVLSVQAQVTANLLDKTLEDDSRGAIRFVTAVDSLNYRQVGFFFDIEGGQTGYKASSTTVYDHLVIVDPRTGEKEKEEQVTPAETFGKAAKYFKTYTFYNLSAKLYDVNITATPFWKTLDGTIVRAASQTKTVNMGRGSKTIYISSDGTDAERCGTKENPCQTLNYALTQAENNDVLYVQNTLAVTENNWARHKKDVMITGGTLDFSGCKIFNIKDSATFTNMTLKFQEEGAVHAFGFRVRIESDIRTEGRAKIYGGGDGTSTVSGTNLTLLGGEYQAVYGGGDGVNTKVTGDVHLTIGGVVNAEREFTKANEFVVYGGSKNSDVTGDVYLSVGGQVNASLDLTKKDANGKGVAYTTLYGGGDGATANVTGSTYITLEGKAQFSRIYGGSHFGTVQGNTNVDVKDQVNFSMSSWTKADDHEWYAALYGGGFSNTSGTSVVGGNTSITIDGDAQFTHVYGGGRRNSSEGLECTVGNTRIHVTKNAKNARFLSIYGGSYLGTNQSTGVVFEAGEVQQIFGGSYRASMTGNTDVRILGGKVTRRVYGGCYNDYSSLKWVTTDHVTGNTSVVIGSEATFAPDTSQNDRGILAGSRYKEDFADETGTILFLGGADYSSKLGSSFFSKKAYNYLVKVPDGGAVTPEGNTLLIIPGVAGTGISMEGVDASYLTETEGGYRLTLPPIAKSGQKTIQIRFYKEAEALSAVTSYSWKSGIVGESVYDCGSLVKTYGQETEPSCQLFHVEGTTDAEVSGYVKHLAGNGWRLKSQTSIDDNQFYRFTCTTLKAAVNYDTLTGDITVILEQNESATPSEISYTYDPKEGEAASFYMFGLKMDPNGYNAGTEGNTNGYPNNGECLVIKCADNSVIIVDGGDQLQMQTADRERFINFLHEITGKASDEVITVSAWYITHIHRDHISGMTTLLKNSAKKLKLERIICNMPSLEAVSTSNPSAGNFQNVSSTVLQYYPQCQEIKVHTGDVLQIADVTMTTLLTHEDIVNADGTFTSTDFNVTSTVMKIETASGMSMVVTGDMNTEAEAILCSRFSYDTLKCDILQQPHHNITNNKPIYSMANAQVMLFTQREGQFERNDACRNRAELAKSYCQEWYCQGDHTVGFGSCDGKVKLIYKEEVNYGI